MNKMSSARSDLLKGPVRPLILHLTLPVMLADFLRTSYSFVDMIFASRLGGVQIASIAFVSPLFMGLNALGMGLSVGGISIIAKQIGEREYEKASEYAGELRNIVLLLSLLLTLFGLLFYRPILLALGLREELLGEASIYSRILLLSIPFNLVSQLYASLYKSQGKMGITTQMSFIAVFGNMLMNYLLISVWKGGIGGLAWASVFVRIVQAAYVIIAFHREEHHFTLSPSFHPLHINFKYWKRIFRVGFPLSFSLASNSFGFLMMYSFIIPYGHKVVSGFAIGNQINSLFFTPATGIGQGLIPLVAQNWGAKKLDRLKIIIKQGLIYAIAFGLVGSFAIKLLISPLGNFLSKGDGEILMHVRNYLHLMSWTLIAWCIFQSMGGIFNGLQRTRVTMTISVLRLWGFRIPGLLLFLYLFRSVGEYGVWYTMFYSNIFAALGALAFYFWYIPPRIYKHLSSS